MLSLGMIEGMVYVVSAVVTVLMIVLVFQIYKNEDHHDDSK
jgi:hypothetical protein